MVISNPYTAPNPDETRLVLTSEEVEQLPPEYRGINQLLEGVDRFIPAIEKMTGLSRRDIFLQLLKSGFKGNMSGFLDGLLGIKPQPVSKFEKYVKTLAIWIPVSIGLFGLIVVILIALMKLVDVLL